MKTSFLEKTLAEVNSVVDKISSKISDDFKGTKPFDKKEITTKQLVRAYTELSLLDKEKLLAKHGKIAVDMFNELEQEAVRGGLWQI